MRDRPRVLVIAEAANPEWVSVPLVGWSLANALRAVADVHVVTQIRNRDALLRAGWSETQDFTAIDSEAVARGLYRAGKLLRGGTDAGWTTQQALSSLGYPWFERLVWRKFGVGIERGDFDVVHRVTPLSPTARSPIAPLVARAGVPFVLGPLNGGVPWPRGFDAERRREREWLSYVRGAYRALPGRRASLRATAAILVGSRHTLSELPDAVRDRALWLPENAVDPARIPPPGPQRGGGVPLRLCFIGRLVPYKGPDMALEAAAPLLRDGRAVLDIVGDGPLRADLQARTAALGVGSAVTFHGQVPHRDALGVLSRAEALVFPSIREFGGGVVLEAMALGVVPVVVDYGGPGELVTPETGFALPLAERPALITTLRATLERLAAAPAALAPLSRAASVLVRDRFTWPAKAQQVACVYDWVLGRCREKPDFAAPTVTARPPAVAPEAVQAQHPP
ncbi:glycosyltransferase [Rhodovulum sp. 12E13]|uniref:glycosyltransferase family 4 protein n=1 Tax=Rhodovulum sp. 12E13 TaxID=2203891 RepID=UPI000E18830D|nr:glycosyltransferase family 4 protein [Rhodovulum sp. 12E13]RDC72198.1 glycosyltransferase [Rhodovulum sp. 12E13]